MPVVLLDTLGGPSPTYLRWLMFAARNGQEPIIAHNASDKLIDRLGPAVIVMVRTLYTMQPCRVEWCERSTAGAEMGAYVARAASEMHISIDFQGRYPSLLEPYPCPGLDVTLTGKLTDDCDTLEAVAKGVGDYLQAKGKN